MKQQITQSVKIIVLGLIVAVGASYVSAAGTWTSAPANPPAGNVESPLNVSNLAQSKLGGLYLTTNRANNCDGLTVQGNIIANNGVLKVTSLTGTKNTINGAFVMNGPVQITSANSAVADGNILVSDAQGNATWKAPSASGGVTKITATAPVAVSPSSGVGIVNVTWTPNNSVIYCSDEISTSGEITGTGLSCGATMSTSGLNGYVCPEGYYVSGIYRKGDSNNRVVASRCNKF